MRFMIGAMRPPGRRHPVCTTELGRTAALNDSTEMDLEHHPQLVSDQGATRLGARRVRCWQRRAVTGADLAHDREPEARIGAFAGSTPAGDYGST